MDGIIGLKYLRIPQKLVLTLKKEGKRALAEIHVCFPENCINVEEGGKAS